jgi:uncharacterized protein YbjT (DUF2867 family)
MRILVTGGTGTIGSQVVRELASRKAKVIVLSRDGNRTSTHPASVKIVEGNLGRPETVQSVFEKVDAVFLLNAMSPTESIEGLMAVCGMRLAGVKRLVYISVQDADKAAWLPHFGAKVGVEEAIRRSGIPFTILRPNHFFQNDYWSRDAMLGAKVYPQPIGDAGLSRVDVRDIAEMAAIALLSPDHAGKTYNVVGPTPLTGTSTAAAWSEALGRPIGYGGDDLDAWEARVRGSMPDWLIFELRLMYQHFQESGLLGTAEDLETVTRVLGHPPRSFSAFTKETAKVWTAMQP